MTPQVADESTGGPREGIGSLERYLSVSTVVGDAMADICDVVVVGISGFT